MNQQTDNMYIDDRYSDEALRKREEIREHISWFREFLTFGTSLPEHIRRRYGLEEDYQRYKKLEIQVHRMPCARQEEPREKSLLRWKRLTKASAPLRQGTIWKKNIRNCSI